jgi:hypothetical protein
MLFFRRLLRLFVDAWCCVSTKIVFHCIRPCEQELDQLIAESGQDEL